MRLSFVPMVLAIAISAAHASGVADGSGSCGALLAPATAVVVGNRETESFISLVRVLVNERNALGLEELELFCRTKPRRLPSEFFTSRVPAAEALAYRQAFNKLLASGRLDWDLILGELPELSKTKAVRDAIRETAKVDTTIVVRDVGVIDSKPSTSSDIGIDGFIKGSNSFLYRHDSPYVHLGSAQRAFGNTKRRFLFNVEKMTAIAVPDAPGPVVRLADGRSVFPMFDRSNEKIGIYDADTGAPIVESTLEQIEGLQGKLNKVKSRLIYNGTVPSLSVGSDGSKLLNFMIKNKPNTFLVIDPASKKIVANPIVFEVAEYGDHPGSDFIASRDGKRIHPFGTVIDRFVLFDLVDDKMTETLSIPLQGEREIARLRFDSFEASTGEIFVPLVFRYREKSYLFNATTRKLVEFLTPQGPGLEEVKVVELSPGEVALVVNQGLEENANRNGRVFRQAIVHFDGQPTELFEWDVGAGVRTVPVSFIANGKYYQVAKLTDNLFHLLDPISHKLMPLRIPRDSTILGSFVRDDGSVDLLIGNEQEKERPLEVYRIVGERPREGQKP